MGYTKIFVAFLVLFILCVITFLIWYFGFRSNFNQTFNLNTCESPLEFSPTGSLKVNAFSTKLCPDKLTSQKAMCTANGTIVYSKCPDVSSANIVPTDTAAVSSDTPIPTPCNATGTWSPLGPTKVGAVVKQKCSDGTTDQTATCKADGNWTVSTCPLTLGDYNILSNNDSTATNLSGGYPGTLDSCKTSCDSIINCNGFVYGNPNLCFLKQNAVSSTATSNTKYSFYYKTIPTSRTILFG